MAVSRLSHRAHLAAGSSTDSCPHAASSAGRGGPEIREPRATARRDRAGARTQAPCRGGVRLLGRQVGPCCAVLCCAVVQGLPPAQHNPEPSPLLGKQDSFPGNGLRRLSSGMFPFQDFRFSADPRETGLTHPPYGVTGSASLLPRCLRGLGRLEPPARAAPACHAPCHR